MMAECLRAVERRGIQDQVHFVGMQKDLEMLYRCCAVYFQPSRVESLGLGVLDAARRGIPAVVSDVGGLPEAVDSGRSGIVYPVHNPNVAVDSLVTLLKDVDRRKEMGNRARDHYAARFTPMKWEAALLKLHMTPPQGTAEAAPSTVDS
jgi:glycosyltransferase involved in cell wall biosynthesis